MGRGDGAAEENSVKSKGNKPCPSYYYIKYLITNLLEVTLYLWYVSGIECRAVYPEVLMCQSSCYTTLIICFNIQQRLSRSLDIIPLSHDITPRLPRYNSSLP